jgi:hypothetical protein
MKVASWLVARGAGGQQLTSLPWRSDPLVGGMDTDSEKQTCVSWISDLLAGYEGAGSQKLTSLSWRGNFLAGGEGAGSEKQTCVTWRSDLLAGCEGAGSQELTSVSWRNDSWLVVRVQVVRS